MSNHARRRHRSGPHSDRMINFCGNPECGGIPTGHWKGDEWVETLPGGMQMAFSEGWAPEWAFNEDGSRWLG